MQTEHVSDAPCQKLAPELATDGSWYTHFHFNMNRTRWRCPTWSLCTFCNAPILKGETKLSCCSRGRLTVPSLPELPPRIVQLTKEEEISTKSRKLNNLFCFTAIGATEGFHHFHSGPSCCTSFCLTVDIVFL
jgi:hypothetical protein